MTSMNFTFNKIQEFWNMHTKTDIIAKLPKSDLMLLNNINFSNSPYADSLFDSANNKYILPDYQHCVVLLIDNSLRLYPRDWISSPLMLEDTIGLVGITYSQLRLIKDRPINKQMKYIVKYANLQQLRYATGIQQIVEKVTDVKKITKDEAKEIWTYHRLRFINDDDIEQIWKTDSDYIWEISMLD